MSLASVRLHDPMVNWEEVGQIPLYQRRLGSQRIVLVVLLLLFPLLILQPALRLLTEKLKLWHPFIEYSGVIVLDM